MKYVLRSVKYLVKLTVLLALVFWLMQVSGTSNLTATGGADGGGIAGFFASFFATLRGQLFTVALLVWCALYPSVEFKRRHLNYSMAAHKDAIVKALRAGGMVLASDSSVPGAPARMIFRGESLVRRVWWLGDEALTITSDPDGGIDIEGPRRFVMEAQHRIPKYVEHES